MKTFVDIMSQIGVFTPTLMIYFPQIQEIDISGCVMINPALFIDCLVAVQNLKKLLLVGCIQFNQYSLVKISVHMKNLTYLDVVHCCEIHHVNLYCILSNLNKLQFINLSPRDALKDIEYFKEIIRIYRDVCFGRNILMYFPNYGSQLHLPMFDEE